MTEELLDYDSKPLVKSSHGKWAQMVNGFIASGRPYAEVRYAELGVVAVSAAQTLYRTIHALELEDTVLVRQAGARGANHRIWLVRKGATFDVE